MQQINSQSLRPGSNYFTVIRLFLASSVIWTHSYWQVNSVESQDEFSNIFGHPISYLAVNGFFFISGFWIAHSAYYSANWAKFMTSRILRIVPAMLLMIALVVGAASLIVSDKYSLVGTDTLKFIAFNSTLLKSHYTISGLYCGSELCIVNGSLWTIPWEFRCYVIVSLALLLPTKFRKNAISAIGWCGILLGLLWNFLPASLFSAYMSDGLIYNMNSFARLFGLFSVGIIAYQLKDKIFTSVPIGAGMIVVAIAEYKVVGSNQLVSLAICYTILSIGFSKVGKFSLNLTNIPDYSYGMYILSFPAMILINNLYPFSSHMALAVATLLLTLPIAAISWHFVERPAIDFSKRLRRQSNSGLNA